MKSLVEVELARNMQNLLGVRKFVQCSLEFFISNISCIVHLNEMCIQYYYSIGLVKLNIATTCVHWRQICNMYPT